MKTVRCIDSHTAGEPTRVVIDGLPDLGTGNVAERCRHFREHFQHYRSFVVDEPRGSEILVGALLVEPSEPGCAAGVIFFNNVSTLQMCGHGTIGLLVTLKYLGRISCGIHRIETPVGIVTATLTDDSRVSVENVRSECYQRHVTVSVPELGRSVTGDIAWGGNWFFLCHDHGVTIDKGNVEELTRVAKLIKRSLQSQKITGRAGAEIDHIELVSPAIDVRNHGRNFVLCPGNAYDRSPCGTGTSAKMACLAAANEWPANQIWRQESVIGSVFEASYERLDHQWIIPTITGTASITADMTLIDQESII
jgi:4-hydroxyproline epimerase